MSAPAKPKPDALPLDVAGSGTPPRGVYVWERSDQRADGVILCTMATPCPACGSRCFGVSLTSRCCVNCLATSVGARRLEDVLKGERDVAEINMRSARRDDTTRVGRPA